MKFEEMAKHYHERSKEMADRSEVAYVTAERISIEVKKMKKGLKRLEREMRFQEMEGSRYFYHAKTFREFSEKLRGNENETE